MSERIIISDITRERIFGMYAGQKIMTSDSFLTEKGSYYKEKPILQMAKIPGVFLTVTPLWKITKEDAIQTILISYPVWEKENTPPPFKDIITDINSDKLLVTIYAKNEYNFTIDFFTGIVKPIPALPALGYGDDRLSYCFDFLRSKGYALPACGYSVKELREQGVFWWPDDFTEKDIVPAPPSKVAIPDYV